MSDNIEKAVDWLKGEYGKRTGMTYPVTRPLLPRDFGKQLWGWKSRETVCIDNDIAVLLYGVWSKELIQIRIGIMGGYIAYLTVGTSLINKFPVFFDGEKFDVEVMSDTYPYLSNFSLLGYAVEPEGRTICNQRP